MEHVKYSRLLIDRLWTIVFPAIVAGKDRAAYCRERAAAARAKAEAMSDYESRQTMLKVAAMWETMAASVETPFPSN